MKNLPGQEVEPNAPVPPIVSDVGPQTPPTRMPEADAGPPPSIEEMKAAIKTNRDRVASELKSTRAARDRNNAQIKRLVADLAEAERLVKALEPRKARK